MLFIVLSVLALGAHCAPVRPPLNQDFSATVEVLLNGKKHAVQNIAADHLKWKVAVVNNYTSYKKVIHHILDCEKNVLTVAEPFFDKEICFNEPVVDYISPADCWSANVASLLITGEYNHTKYTGSSSINGKTVEIWTRNDTTAQSIPFHFNKIIINVTLWTINADVYYVEPSGQILRIDTVAIEKITGVPFRPPFIVESNIYNYLYQNVVSPANPSSFNPPSGVTCESDGVASGTYLHQWKNNIGRRPVTGFLNGQHDIDAINSARLGWKAGYVQPFSGGPVQHVGKLRRWLGTMPGMRVKLDANIDLVRNDGAIPASFDARQKWGQMCPSIGMVRNSGSCSSGWAFAAVDALADRFCIASGGKTKLTLSPEYLLDCDSTNANCNGGWLDNAWRYLQSDGVVLDTCRPYTHCDYAPNINCSSNVTASIYADVLPEETILGSCPTNCSDGSKFQKYKAKSAYAVGSPGDMAAMQTEIMTKGPIGVSFFVYQDFFQYVSGVYTRSPFAGGPLGNPLGGHAVKVIGWGVEGNASYWLAVNSWSPQWGEKGLFRIVRGKNECGFEMTPAAGDPAL